METATTRTRSYLKQIKMDVDQEPHFVLIQLADETLKLTYSKRSSNGVIRMIEVMNNETPTIGCSFKGKASECDADAYHLKDLKKDIQGIRPNDWSYNSCYIDSWSTK